MTDLCALCCHVHDATAATRTGLPASSFILTPSSPHSLLTLAPSMRRSKDLFKNLEKIHANPEEEWKQLLDTWRYAASKEHTQPIVSIRRSKRESVAGGCPASRAPTQDDHSLPASPSAALICPR